MSDKNQYTRDQLLSLAELSLVIDSTTLGERVDQWIKEQELHQAPPPAKTLLTKPFNLEEWIKGGSRVEDVLYQGSECDYAKQYGLRTGPEMLIVLKNGNTRRCTPSFGSLTLIDRSEQKYLWRNVSSKGHTSHIDHEDEKGCIEGQANALTRENTAICRIKLQETAPGQFVFVEAIPY